MILGISMHISDDSVLLPSSLVSSASRLCVLDCKPVISVSSHLRTEVVVTLEGIDDYG